MIGYEIETRFKTYLDAAKAGTAIAAVPVVTSVPDTNLQYPHIMVRAYGLQKVSELSTDIMMQIDVSLVSEVKSDNVWHLTHKSMAGAMTTLLDDPNIFGQTFRSLALVGVKYFVPHQVSAAVGDRLTADTMTFRLVLGGGQLVTYGYTAGYLLPNISYRHYWEDIWTAYLQSALSAELQQTWEIVPSYYGGARPRNRIVSQFVMGERNQIAGFYLDRSLVTGETRTIQRAGRPFSSSIMRFEIASGASFIVSENHQQAAADLKDAIFAFTNNDIPKTYTVQDKFPQYGPEYDTSRQAVLSSITPKNYTESENRSEDFYSSLMQIEPPFYAITPRPSPLDELIISAFFDF